MSDYDDEDLTADYVRGNLASESIREPAIDLSDFDLIADEDTIRRLSKAMYYNDPVEVGKILAGVYLGKPGDTREIKARRRQILREMTKLRQELVKLNSYPAEPPPEVDGVPTTVTFKKCFGRDVGTFYTYAAVRSMLGWSITGAERTGTRNMTWKKLVDFSRQAETEWPTILVANGYSTVE